MRVNSLLALTALAFTSSSAAPQQTKAANQPPVLPYVVPPTRSVLGKSYAQWSAAWWKWALETPGACTPCSPTFDVTLGQSGDVWFLAGVFGVCVRQVRIPAGKWLFMPMANAEASDMEPPPYFGCTAAEQAAAATVTANYIRQPFFELDGAVLPMTSRHRVVSPQFGAILPDTNCLGIPVGTRSVCPIAPLARPTSGPASIASPTAVPMHGTFVSDGYWVMLEPLPVGTHLVRFGGKFMLGPVLLGEIDMTYFITVF